MKAISIQDNLQFVLEIVGESWNQGDQIKGAISVKNVGNKDKGGDITVRGLTLYLAHGVFKKVHERAKGSWSMVTPIILCDCADSGSDSGGDLEKSCFHLASGGERKFNWKYKIATDAAVTDKNGSLFLLYGTRGILSAGLSLDNWAHLQLIVEHHPYINFYLETMERFLRFKIKQKKFNKSGWVEVKMAAPDSKEWANVEGVTCSLRLAAAAGPLQVKYLFNIKSLQLGAAGQLEVQRKEKEFSLELSSDKFLLYGGPNHQGIQDSFWEAAKIFLKF